MSSQVDQSKTYLKTIMIISTFGGLLFGYDTGVVNGALQYMAQPDQLNLTPLDEGMVASSLLLGATFGALVGGKLSDMQGRRKNIFMLSILFFVSTLGCSLAPDLNIMLISRFFLGLAVGGASVTVPAYLAEISPSNKRGRMVTQNELMIVTGQFLAFAFNAIIAIALEGNPHVWRYMLSVAAVPAVVLFFGMMRLPESPRWLVSKGKISDALAVLKKVRPTEAHAISELNDIQDIISKEKSAKPVSLKELNTPWIRRILLIGTGIASCVQLTGIVAIVYYATQILTQSGFGMQTALITNTLNGLTSVISVSFGIYLLGKVKRRTMMLTGFSGTTTALLLMTIVANVLAGSPYLPYAILALLVMFLAFMQSCLGPILWLSLSEIIPLRIRGIGMGICVFFNWMVNVIVGLVFPVLMSVAGMSMTFGVFVIIGFFSIAFTYFFVPETKGKSLEQIEEEFRHYDRKKIQSAGIGDK